MELYRDAAGPNCGRPALRWGDLIVTGFAPRIIVPAKVSKTGNKRSVPISANLMQWVEILRRSDGSICGDRLPWKPIPGLNGHSAIDIIVGSIKSGWKKNALRHSFGTYRVIRSGSIAKTALEMGNSEAIIKAHYYDAGKSESEASDWFSIAPNDIDRSGAIK